MALNPESGEGPDSDEALRRAADLGSPILSADPTTARWLAWLKEDGSGRTADKSEPSLDHSVTKAGIAPGQPHDKAAALHQPSQGPAGADLDDTAVVEAPPFPVSGLSLFWRTFGLISLLVGTSTLIWQQTLHLLADESRQGVWLLWLVVGVLLTLASTAVVAHLINQPFKQLSFATSRIREGDFEASRLNERVPTTEIRQVNIGFNRMAQRLAKLDQDRAVMLAGISHDLRTPLSRLRLETEMSVADADARAHMVADLEQLDAIIDKFMDYARPDHVRLERVNLNEVIRSSLYAFEHREDMRFNIDLPTDLWVMADAVELGRVISNLVENARRYGKTPETGITTLDIGVRAREPWVQLRLRDHGPGVAPEHLPNLTKPFYRGDAARTAATGAGLGLAIVDKTLRRMGGRFGVGNSSLGGFSTRIELRQAK
ncbi:histidine kinase [Hylemonella gracilis str. Niagara R]|uniref:histidine kinase n=1 Tax=Hylemonella gracilis str. Niagara R TaxID=1458275 RepID=A0A016XH86_9BURK|nr:ATP-binding protein [Hylemonella gracilis]EYC51275.1 histidine kinase [Hylemonella gracilis str. Niagara R]